MILVFFLNEIYSEIPRWKSRIYASIYKRHSTGTVVNKDKCLYWTVGTGPRVGAVLAQYSPSPEIKCRLITDFRVIPVLNQYRFQCWHGTDFQYRASTNGQLAAKLPIGAAPVVGRAYVRTMSVSRQYCKSFCGTGTVPSRL